MNGKQFLALQCLYEFWYLWKFDQWKYLSKSDGVTHTDYQSIVAIGLAQSQSVEKQDFDTFVHNLDSNPKYGLIRKALYRFLYRLGEKRGLFDGETVTVYQITQKGLDLWMLIGKQTVFDKTFGSKTR